jgi:hypothetical protein
MLNLDAINELAYDIKRAAFKSQYQIPVTEILCNVKTSCLPSSIMNDISVHVITDNPVFVRQNYSGHSLIENKCIRQTVSMQSS